MQEYEIKKDDYGCENGCRCIYEFVNYADFADKFDNLHSMGNYTDFYDIFIVCHKEKNYIDFRGIKYFNNQTKKLLKSIINV